MATTSPPDWQRLERAEGVVLLGPYAEGGAYCALPEALGLARDGTGRPELRLELIRGANPALPPAPYGVLELSLALEYPIAAALELARGAEPAATVARAAAHDAWISLRVLGDLDRPEDLGTPAPVRWVGLDRATWVLRLSTDTSALVRDCLERGTVALGASAQLEIEAIAPRLPLRARAAPKAVADRLRAHADAEGRIARPQLVEHLSAAPAELPFEFQGPIADVPGAELAERLADLVRTHVASFAPNADGPDPLLELKPAEALESEPVEWDLSRPERTARPLTLNFDPLAEPRRWEAEHGGDDFVSESVIPPFPTGISSIAVDASLPPVRRGVLETGVTVSVPANPPARVQPIVKTVTLSPPDDRAELQLRLAPGEALEYGYVSYAVVKDAGGIERLDEPERTGYGERLALTTADFPVRFLTVAASPALLEVAEVTATIERSRDGAPVSERFPLTAEAPALAIAVPRDEDGAGLAVEARQRDGERAERIDDAAGALIDLHSFGGYGPHVVEIECAFDGGEDFVAIELVPESRTADPSATGVVHLTPAEPRKTWSWFSDSPFEGGFRYRPYARPGETPAGWSEVCDPGEPLIVRTGAMV